MGAALHHEMGRLTIGVDKEDSAIYNLVLSETVDMEICTPRLNAEISERITNISVDDLPGNLNAIDGQHNGENYVAYTFYCKNNGQVTLDYNAEAIKDGSYIDDYNSFYDKL
jgi:hypothetical protein